MLFVVFYSRSRKKEREREIELRWCLCVCYVYRAFFLLLDKRIKADFIILLLFFFSTFPKSFTYYEMTFEMHIKVKFMFYHMNQLFTRFVEFLSIKKKIYNNVRKKNKKRKKKNHSNLIRERWLPRRKIKKKSDTIYTEPSLVSLVR